MQLYIVNLLIRIMVPFDKYKYFLFVTILHILIVIVYSPCLPKNARANLH